ncbi:MAG: GntR family transcriptional regulator [Acholeplasmataceae bacterium]|nr:GntR family transcriptional regulator [Acholeplasmataceae bacterium]
MRNIVVRNTTQTPIYQQIFDQLSSQIMNGDLKADQPLPSMRTAAKELRVSIITIKKTWELLESQGLIYTIQGKGAYVRGHSKVDLDVKKLEIIKEVMTDAIDSIKSYQLPKEKIIEIINDIYEEKD